MKNLVILAAFLVSISLFSQHSEYIDKKQFKFSPSLSQLLSFEKAKTNFTFFNVDESLYDLIFYKGYLNEKGSNSKYIKLDLLLLKEYTIKSSLYPDYKFILNPNLDKSQFSRHLFTIHSRDSSVTANFHTKSVAVIFPKNILKTLDSLETRLLIKTDWGIEHNNIPYTNTQEGLNIKQITDYKIPNASIPNSIFNSINFDDGQLDYRIKEAYDKIYIPIEDNELSNFIYNYKNVAEIKSPISYKNAIQFKYIKGKIELNETYDCDIEELYFFENIIAGVITLDNVHKEVILKDLSDLKKRTYKLDKNGKFPKTPSFYIKNTYFQIEQDFKNLKLYFFIIK